MLDKNHKNNFGVLILAGGNSERMGEPKAFLKIRNITFIEKIMNEYLKIFPEKITVVLNKNLITEKFKNKFIKKTKKIEIVKNSFPEFGRFYSIKLGLNQMNEMDFCFIQNVDNPFIDEELLLCLKENKNSNGYVIPVYNNEGGHPILVSKKLIEKINSLKGWNYNFKDILKNFKKTELKVNEPKVLVNINTKDEYEKYFA